MTGKPIIESPTVYPLLYDDIGQITILGFFSQKAIFSQKASLNKEISGREIIYVNSLRNTGQIINHVDTLSFISFGESKTKSGANCEVYPALGYKVTVK